MGTLGQNAVEQRLSRCYVGEALGIIPHRTCENYHFTPKQTIIKELVYGKEY